MEAALIVLEGKYKGCEIPLPETIFLIGRDRQCHLRPSDPSVSKLHCAIAAWAGQVRVRDLKSRNGTLLNDQPIDGEITVGDGDRLQVGALVFAFRIKTERASRRLTPINEQDVRWLLDSPSDAAAAPGSTIAKDVKAEPDPAEEGSPSAAAKPGGSKAIAAGQHLRDYFEYRKSHPTPTPRITPPPI
jgi:pSer/pThr/pTyr-binding forkhead associated (FHA) protein